MKENRTIMIWGREFSIDIILGNYDDEPISSSQIDTMKKIDMINWEEAKEKVISYIMDEYEEEIGNTLINNIFEYVIPKKIMILSDYESRAFALMCNFRLDIEHGLAVFFENESCKEVGPQDIVL